MPQFPWVHVCRLLVSQLREEKQQHEEKVEGLHLDICSLKQLSQQQAALIQDLQQHQGQEGLQHHVLRLKEENWVRRGAGLGLGLASTPLPCGELQQPLREQCGGPCCIPPALLHSVGAGGGLQLREAG